jgi:PST family polysaccharide transporter
VNSRRRLRENIASLAALQLLSYAAPLLTVPYLVRVLGPAQFGLVAFAQGLVLYFSVVTDFGFNFSATRAIAAQRNEPSAVARIFWSTLCARAILMLGSAVVLSLLVVFTPKLRETALLFAATFLYVIGTAFFPVWLFQGLELMKLAALVFGIARLLTVPALFLLVRHPQDYVKAAAIQASVEVTATLLAAPVLWKRMKVYWFRPSFSDIAETFRRGWPLFLSSSALYLCTSSTPVILGFVSNKTQVGYFSAADKLIRAATSLLSPVSQALYPYLTAMKAESTLSALQLIRKSFISIGLLSLGASVLIFALASPLSTLVFGSEFGDSAHVLQWLSPLPLLFGLMNVLGTQTMLVFEMDRKMSQIMLAGAAVGIPLSVALSFLFGALGAASATLIMTALMVLAMFVTLRLDGFSVWRPSRQRSSALLIAPAPERTEF